MEAQKLTLFLTGGQVSLTKRFRLWWTKLLNWGPFVIEQ